jgi:hypothetical protein
MNGLEIANQIDIVLGRLLDKTEQTTFFKNMFISECKYNLDILAIIRVNKREENHKQLRDVIQLLENESLKSLILYSNYNEFNSIIMSISNTILKSLNELLITKYEFDDLNRASFFIDLNKRICVLKAISKLEEPYLDVHDLDLYQRLINLKKILLNIVNSLVIK